MQSRDETDRVVGTSLVDLSKMDDIRKRVEMAEAAGAVSHTIGKFPKVRKRFMLGGLEYEVYFVSPQRGKFQAKLVTPSDEVVESLEVAGELETYSDLHSLSIDLANQLAHDNGIGKNRKEGFASHISYVTKLEPIEFAMPKGQVVKVTVEFVDESEALPPTE